MEARFRHITDREGSYGFRTFTYPALKHLLNFRPDAPPVLAIGASRRSEPVGLALASLSGPGHRAEVQSIFIRRDARGAGIATALLGTLEDAARARGACELTGVFQSDIASRPALDALLRRNGFGEPVLSSLVLRIATDRALASRWLQDRALPAGHEAVHWTDVPPNLRQDLASPDGAYDWIPRALHPLNHWDSAEPGTSVALLHGGRLRGWCITHDVLGELRFTSSFVHPAYQARGWVRQLWRRSALGAERHGWPEGVWTVPTEFPRMLTFARRHMVPTARHAAAFLRTRKPL